MLELKNLLTIYHYNSSLNSFSDATMALGTSLAPNFTVTLNVGDYIYIGYHKPIKNFYAELTNRSHSHIYLWESHASTGWQTINVVDETEGFIKSGMVQWEEQEDTALTTINGKELHWIRISCPDATSEPSLVLKFIGLVLSTDNDLLLENPYILDTNILGDQVSHINAHISARNEIVQTFKNKGENFGLWDILDIHEFRQSSLFLALSKVYFNLSDNIDDTWMQKSREYRKHYLDQVNLYWKTIDKNNNGKVDRGENAVSSTKTLFR